MALIRMCSRLDAEGSRLHASFSGFSGGRHTRRLPSEILSGRRKRAGYGAQSLSLLRSVKLAASFQQDGSSQEMLHQLQSQLNEASAQEDYAKAASIRDTISTLLESDPKLRFKVALEKAIVEERYADAANYRDELESLQEKPHNELKCYSDTRTEGIRVQVRSVYVSTCSQPCKSQYFFAYRVRISNESFRPVKIIRRHWVVTDNNGHIEHIRGFGVIGQQPILLPGGDFEYSSACPLGTSTGKMEGDLEMMRLDESSMSTFNVKMGCFGFKMTSGTKRICSS